MTRRHSSHALLPGVLDCPRAVPRTKRVPVGRPRGAQGMLPDRREWGLAKRGTAAKRTVLRPARAGRRVQHEQESAGTPVSLLAEWRRGAMGELVMAISAPEMHAARLGQRVHELQQRREVKTAPFGRRRPALDAPGRPRPRSTSPGQGPRRVSCTARKSRGPFRRAGWGARPRAWAPWLTTGSTSPRRLDPLVHNRVRLRRRLRPPPV